ncbi:maestro heat-like repeat-containing protein family member 1 isoform X1 [Copidosoma floridanum]|uniref:maestro heat-like repeat-containing protein family member 1 isoform X1 n=1 Tax=Copidosoma floridanum TaxID=29053 RepID=UPI0006C9B022|nr:maestro heat-like repeat-containing protein family member 1 isoform X1 [Copidosoma floridanum]
MKDENDANESSFDQLSAVVGALLDALSDKDETVQLSAIESIRKLSQRKAVVVIHAAVYFWELHKKISDIHLIAVLKIMSDICQNYVDSLEDSLATSIADLALNEIVGPASQQACELLVALSKKECSQSIGALIVKFEPNIVPHHNVIRVIGMIAAKNTTGMQPFIKVTLSFLVPLMPDMNQEQLKLATTFAIEKLSDAISDCLTNTEITTNTGLHKDMYFDELSSAFKVLTYSWLKSSKNSTVTENTLKCLASILPLLPKTWDESFIPKVTPSLLSLFKKPNTRLAASRVLSLILNAATSDEKEQLRLHLEHTHHVLLEAVSIAPFEAARDELLAHYEVLKCFKAIVVLYPEEGLDRILQQLKSQNVVQRSKALVVLRHFINTLPAEESTAFQRIASSLQDSLGDANYTRHLVSAMVALAARPTFPLLSSQRSSFVKFIVLQCGSKTDEADACEEALHLLSSTVEGAETWLWPSLINALLDQTYVISVGPILRALSTLAVKMMREKEEEEEENNSVTTGDEKNDFPSIRVLGRCLELLDEEKNRAPVIMFLRSAAPLFEPALLRPAQWDAKLSELLKLVIVEYNTVADNNPSGATGTERALLWERGLVDFLEENETWAQELANELADKPIITPSIALSLAALVNKPEHASLLIELARTRSASYNSDAEYARAVGICAKRRLQMVLKLMEEACAVEDARKQPVRLLGLVRDAKAAANNEAAKAGLLKAYAEIALRADSVALCTSLDNNIFPWIIRQLNDCKELGTKEAGLLAIRRAGEAMHPNRLVDSIGLRARGNALAILLGLFQSSSSGYRPLQLYPLILKAIISLIIIPPPPTDEEKKVLLESSMDKVIAASSEIAALKMPQVMQQVIEYLGVISSEIVSDSSDTLALLVDILLPWMQSKSSAERKTTLLILRTTLRSYHDALKYTYPGGKLEPGKLLGKFLAWSADSDLSLRPLVIDCVALALNIGARHRSTLPDSNLNHDLSETKRIIVGEDAISLYTGVKNLATAACARVASGEVVSLADGLVEALLYRGEGGIAAGIALSELFKLRGLDIPRANLYLIDGIIGQMRQMENASCKRGAAGAVKSLSTQHPQEVVEHLLHQPLPLDRGTKECWMELGKSEDTGSRSLELLLTKLQNENLLVDSALQGGTADDGKRPSAAFAPLAAVVALGQLLNSPKAEDLVSRRLPELFAVLLEYLAGWLHVDPPMSIISTKYGFVPNRQSCKIVPYREVYAVLSKILNIIGTQQDIEIPSTEAVSLFICTQAFESEQAETEENVIWTVHAIARSLSKKSDSLANLGRYLGKLVTSTLATQRAVSIGFYAELVDKLNCDDIWLDAIINTLYEAKADSSPLVRKLATIGLGRVAYLESKHVEQYFDNCLCSLLDGLEEPSSVDGSTDVVLESLRGLSVLLSTTTEKPISPRVVLALKPFVEKENWEMRLAAMCALGAIARSWQSRFMRSPDDDITDHLLACIPCLAIKLEDNVDAIAVASRQVWYDSACLLQCKTLTRVIQTHFGPDRKQLDVENFLRDLIYCLKTDLPQRAEELRNAVVRGYSRSENGVTRATSALILGLFGEPRPKDVQRMLQLLKDPENFVRARAARGLSLCFTL